MKPETAREGSTLRHSLAVLRRRWPLVLAFTIAVPAAAYYLSTLQSTRYEAMAQVLVSRQNLAASLTNTVDPTVYQQPDRVLDTQAQLAREPEVARRVLQAIGLHRTPDDLLRNSSVSPEANVDLLDFRVRDGNADLAKLLATSYANQFTRYREQIDTSVLRSARQDIQARLTELRRAGDHTSALYQSLADTAAKLRTMEALQKQNTYVARAATDATKVQPKPVRNAVLGGLVGLFLGIVAAYLREAFDTRVRSERDIAERLGLPLLGRLPRPRRRLQRANDLVMVSEPSSAEGEAFRILRTNVEFVNIERDARTIMVTSAVEREGKSTTTANLGVAFARAGRRVVLVDLDLRRPFLARFFDLEGLPGLTDVALGNATLEEAVVSIPIPAVGGASSNGRGTSINVLSAGTPPPDPGEFVEKRIVGDILTAARENADVVLVDSPPLLHVGDAVTLSAKVDALMIVTRLNVLTRSTLAELARVVESLPNQTLGFAVTDAGVEGQYGYDYYAAAAPRRQWLGRGRRSRAPVARS